MSPSIGAVLVQVLNCKARTIELARRVKETEELEERLTALEVEAKADKEAGRQWG